MIEITINIPALDRLVDAIAAGGVTASGAATAAKPETKAAPKKAPAKEEAKKPEPKAEAAEEGTKADGDIPSQDDLKTAAITLSSKNGREALEAALKEHGATAGISSIPDDKKADFVAFCEQAVE